MTDETDAAVVLRTRLEDAIRVALGYERGAAEDAANRIAQALSNRPGWLYVPRRLMPSSDRDAAIAREFRGNNVDELCRRFHVGRSTVYAALKSSKKLAKTD